MKEQYIYCVVVRNKIPAHVTGSGLFVGERINERELQIEASSDFVARGMAMAKMRIEFGAAGLGGIETKVLSWERLDQPHA